MGIFSALCNEALIRELSRELNTDVLLFGFDGFTYFGNLQAIDFGRIAVLAPASVSGVTDVEIQTPGGETEFVSSARVDLWQIVGKGTSIATDPLNAEDNAPPAPAAGVKADDPPGRQESHLLINQLKRMIGDVVVITTLGGFLFTGILTDVRCELAVLTVDEIAIPGTSTAIPKSEVKSAVVNLEALTSVSSEAT